MDDQSHEDPGKTGQEGEERPLSDSLREAVEGAFAATGLTRDRAQDLVESKVPAPTVDDYARALTTGADRRSALGIVVFVPPGASTLA